MSSSSVARRYARALLSIGLEDGQFAQYGLELGRMERAFASSAELRDLWVNPAYAREARLTGLENLVGPLELSPMTANLMRLLVERQRMGDLPSIASAYEAMVDERVGRVRAVVTSARPLTGDQQAQVQRALAGSTGKQILLQAKVDASLIGGVSAQVGSTVFDGSVKTQLERLRDTLAAGH